MFLIRYSYFLCFEEKNKKFFNVFFIFPLLVEALDSKTEDCFK